MKKVSSEVREYFSAMGKKGAQIRLAEMSPERKKAVATKAARARWKDHIPKPKQTSV